MGNERAEEMIDRVVEGEDPKEVIEEDLDNDAWERVTAEKLYKEYKEGKIKMLSAEETDKVVSDLKRKWSL